MSKRRLGRSELQIEPLVLGTNVIGGTIDEARSFEVLDAFLAARLADLSRSARSPGGPAYQPLAGPGAAPDLRIV